MVVHTSVGALSRLSVYKGNVTVFFKVHYLKGYWSSISHGSNDRLPLFNVILLKLRFSRPRKPGANMAKPTQAILRSLHQLGPLKGRFYNSGILPETNFLPLGMTSCASQVISTDICSPLNR